MNTEPIKSLHIENFKAFKTFDMPEVKKINLIGGMNNAGKTALLEAVYILCSGGAKLYSLANFRTPSAAGIIAPATQDEDSGAADAAWLTSMWTGFPAYNEGQDELIRVEDQMVAVTLQRGYLSSADGRSDFWALEGTELTLPSGAPAYEASYFTNESFRDKYGSFCTLLSNRESNLLRSAPYMRERAYYRSSMREVMDLARCWDKVAMTPAEQEVVGLLRFFEPSLDRLAFIRDRLGKRTPYFTRVRDERRYPLALMGDGMNHVLAVGLMLGMMKDGVVLLDEIENGLHYSVQEMLWRAIIRYTKKRPIQVFATTHSSDTLLALARAAKAEGEEDCQFIRLEREGDSITPYTAGVEAMLGSKEYDVELR